MKIQSPFHLTYCTNIHPGESWLEVFEQLKQHIPAIKSQVSADQPFGIGLRLANLASEELLEGDNLKTLRQWLDDQQCYVFTLNGFPYGKFHGRSVKEDVHAPDWLSEERIEYTKRLFTILEQLLPEGMDGGVSTSPLSYRFWYDNELGTLNRIFQQTAKNIIEVVKPLIGYFDESGKHFHLDIEPEPDGMLENSEELIAFFNNYLLPVGIHELSQHFNISQDDAKAAILRHVQVCYDVCHFAVGFEKPKNVFAQLEENGIKVGKIQISAAMAVDIKSNFNHQDKIKDQLRSFSESTYLHQVVGRDKNKNLIKYQDLPDAFPRIFKDAADEWRIHFHVPIFVEKYSDLKSTQKQIVKVLDYIKKHPVTNHLEVETYTWDVLPDKLKKNIDTSISRELEWVKSNF